MTSLFFARRLTLSADGHRSTPAVKVATSAVALSIAVMLAAAAIVSGFKKEITAKVRGFNSDITLTVQPSEQQPDYLLTLTPTLRSILDSLPYVTDYALNTAAPAVIKTDQDFKGVYLKSLAGSNFRSFIASSLEEGKVPDYEAPGSDSLILISRIAANQLNLKTDDSTDLYFFTESIKARRLKIAGIFNSHFDTYDDVYVYGAPKLLNEVGNLSPNQGTSLSISTNDFANIGMLSDHLQLQLFNGIADGRLYKSYKVENARSSGANFFNWLDLLDMNVIVILVLMTLVGCVTLVSGMLIMIADKKRFIALLKALGAPRRLLSRIFVLLALRVALTGMVIGNVLILAFLFLQQRYHFIPLDPDSYYIDFVPVDITWTAVLLINAAVLLIAWIVLILPSRFVGSISPAAVLAEEA